VLHRLYTKIVECQPICELNIDMNRKFLIIAPPRTGSTSYAFQLGKEYAVRTDPSIELFHPDYVSLHYQNKSMAEFLQTLTHNSNWVFKIQPMQLLLWYHNTNGGCLTKLTSNNQWLVNAELLEFYSDLIECSNHHIYLYRRNFIDQVLSRAVAYKTNKFFIDREATTPIILSDHEIMLARQEIYYQWQIIKILYNHKPGKVIALEDHSDNLYIKKYPRYQNVVGNTDLISDFDVESEIFGIKKEGYCTPLNLNQS